MENRGNGYKVDKGDVILTTEQLYIKLSSNIKREIEPLRKDLKELSGDFRSMETIVSGNGSKGHEQRLDVLENWKTGRPAECPAKPLSKGDVMKRRVLEVSVMALVISVVQVVVIWLPQIVR